MISDRVIFVCTLIIAAAYFYGTAQIPSLQIGDPLGPRAFPYLVGIGLLVAGGWLLLEMLQSKKAAQPATHAESEDRRHLILIGAVVAWLAIYFALFERLGFLLSTPVFLFVLMAYLNRGKWMANGLTSVLFTLGAYALFNHVLGVPLAKGPLGF